MFTLLTLLQLVSPAFAAKSKMAVDSPSTVTNDGLTVAEEYELGLKYLKRGYYEKSLEQFNRIRIYHRDDPVSVKAELALADVYYRKSEWDQARLAYDDFQRMHPRHPDLDYVVFRTGMCLLKKAPKVAAKDQTWTAQVVNTWTGFDRRFPNSEWTAEVSEHLIEAQDRLAKKELIIAQFYERRAAWPAVENRAAGLTQDYPESAYVDDALTLLAESVARQGRTEEALAVADRLAQKDPEAASALREHIQHLDVKAP